MATSPARTALCPGSFDPVHLGHLDVIEQAASLFDTVIVAVMHNPSKPSGLFSPDERAALIRESTATMSGVSVVTHGGLAVQAALDVSADVIVKGLRTGIDFDVEQQMAQNNHALTSIRTVFVPCAPALSHISSRFVREIAAHGRDVGHLVPAIVATELRRVIDGAGG